MFLKKKIKKKSEPFLSLHCVFPKNRELIKILMQYSEICPPNNLFILHYCLWNQITFLLSISPYPAKIDSNLEILCLIAAAWFSKSKFAIFLIFLGFSCFCFFF